MAFFNDNFMTSSSLAAMDEMVIKVIHLEREYHKEVGHCKTLSNQIKNVDRELEQVEYGIATSSKKKEALPQRIDVIVSNIESISKSLPTVKEQIANLKKSLELEKIKSSEDIKRYKNTLAHYESLWDSYDAIYERRPLAIKRKEMKIQIKMESLELAYTKVKCKDISEKTDRFTAIREKQCTIRIIQMANNYKEWINIANQKVDLCSMIQKLQNTINDLSCERESLFNASLISHIAAAVPTQMEIEAQVTPVVLVAEAPPTKKSHSETLMFPSFELPKLQMPKLASPPRKNRCYRDLRNQPYTGGTPQFLAWASGNRNNSQEEPQQAQPTVPGSSPNACPSACLVTSTPLQGQGQQPMEMGNVSTIAGPNRTTNEMAVMDDGADTFLEESEKQYSSSSIMMSSSDYDNTASPVSYQQRGRAASFAQETQRISPYKHDINTKGSSQENKRPRVVGAKQLFQEPEDGVAVVDVRGRRASWSRNASQELIETHDNDAPMDFGPEQGIASQEVMCSETPRRQKYRSGAEGQQMVEREMLSSQSGTELQSASQQSMDRERLSSQPDAEWQPASQQLMVRERLSSQPDAEWQSASQQSMDRERLSSQPDEEWQSASQQLMDRERLSSQPDAEWQSASQQLMDRERLSSQADAEWQPASQQLMDREMLGSETEQQYVSQQSSQLGTEKEPASQHFMDSDTLKPQQPADQETDMHNMHRQPMLQDQAVEPCLVAKQGTEAYDSVLPSQQHGSQNEDYEVDYSTHQTNAPLYKKTVYQGLASTPESAVLQQPMDTENSEDLFNLSHQAVASRLSQNVSSQVLPMEEAIESQDTPLNAGLHKPSVQQGDCNDNPAEEAQDIVDEEMEGNVPEMMEPENEEYSSTPTQNLSQTSHQSIDDVMDPNKRRAFLKQLMKSPEFNYQPRLMRNSTGTQDNEENITQDDNTPQNYFINSFMNFRNHNSFHQSERQGDYETHQENADYQEEGHTERQMISQAHMGGGDAGFCQGSTERETMPQANVGGDNAGHQRGDTERETILQARMGGNNAGNQRGNKKREMIPHTHMGGGDLAPHTMNMNNSFNNQDKDYHKGYGSLDCSTPLAKNLSQIQNKDRNCLVNNPVLDADCNNSQNDDNVVPASQGPRRGIVGDSKNVKRDGGIMSQNDGFSVQSSRGYANMQTPSRDQNQINASMYSQNHPIRSQDINIHALGEPIHAQGQRNPHGQVENTRNMSRERYPNPADNSYEHYMNEYTPEELRVMSPYFKGTGNNLHTSPETNVWSPVNAGEQRIISETPGWKSPDIISPEMTGSNLFGRQTGESQGNAGFFNFGSTPIQPQQSAFSLLGSSEPPVTADAENRQPPNRSELFTFNFDSKSNTPSIFKLF